MAELDLERDERISRLLDDIRQTGSTIRDADSLRQTYPDLAEDVMCLLEAEQALQAAVTDWKEIGEHETLSRVVGADSVETAGDPNSGPNRSASVPATIGRYRISRKIGEGGMGAVYEAEDPQLQRRVAIKIPHFTGSDEQKKQSQLRFLRESRSAAAVEHPNVCAIHDVGEHEGRPFVVMTYVEGESLADCLRRTPVRDTGEAARLIVKTAAGLAAVHSHGIVHRDMKPANILVRQKDGEPILTDFGLAQITCEAENLTAAGAILGTPAYMAPEQADPSLGAITAQTDVYSLGVILFEMVTGRRPFQGSQFQLITQVGSKQIPRASEFRKDLDPTLDEIIRQATARNRDDRYAQATDFARALSDWLDGEVRPATAKPAKIAAKQKRPRWLVPCTVAAILAVAIGGYLLSRDEKSGTQPPESVATENGVEPKPGVQEALRGSIDVKVWRKDRTAAPAMHLDHPAALPLAPGDWVRIEVELNRPAYAYIVWIDTEGKATPLYPWIDDDWTKRPMVEKIASRLSLPDTANSMAPLGGGPAGIETLLLLARDEPLPADVDLAQIFADLPKQETRDLRTAAWFQNGELVRNEVNRGPIRLDQAKESDDPVLKTQSLLKSRLKGSFSYTRGVSFANRGD